MTEREFESISRQLGRLEDKIDNLERKMGQDTQLLSEKLELYRQTGEAQIQSIRAEVEAFQEANKQQLNVSLGVLVTAAITIVASVVIGMQ